MKYTVHWCLCIHCHDLSTSHHDAGITVSTQYARCISPLPLQVSKVSSYNNMILDRNINTLLITTEINICRFDEKQFQCKKNKTIVSVFVVKGLRNFASKLYYIQLLASYNLYLILFYLHKIFTSKSLSDLTKLNSIDLSIF